MDYKGIMEKPFFTLSVRARGGTMLEQSQDTPPGVFSRGVMTADQALVLSTPISELPQGVKYLVQKPSTQRSSVSFAFTECNRMTEAVVSVCSQMTAAE